MKGYNDPFGYGSFNDWQEVDIIVSRDCLLRCTYCYLDKKKDVVYDLETIINNADILLSHIHENLSVPGIVFGLYPEPWVNINRTNEIITRIIKLLPKYPKFISNYMFSLGTCGVNLQKEIPILSKIPGHYSIQVTLDGIQEQHDMFRVFPNGDPSWELIKNNILEYQQKYNIYTTKVTLGPESIKYIYDSTLFLWNEMNINSINMNVVFEDVWVSEYEKLKSLNEFDNQLNKLTKYIIENNIYKTKYISILGNIQLVFEKNFINQIYCGAAVMRSIDSDGSIYPCFRLSPYSLDENTTFKIKPNDNKFETSEVERSLKLLNNFDAAPQKCLNCELINSCSMCVGGAYEEQGTLYYRTVHHCEFIKIQNKYATILNEYILGEEND